MTGRQAGVSVGAVIVAFLVYAASPWESPASRLRRAERSFLAAVERGETFSVRLALVDGVGPEIQGKALPVAAAHGHEEIVTLLFQWGTPVSVTDANGKTALYWARRNGHAGVVRLLKQAGARE